MEDTTFYLVGKYRNMAPADLEREAYRTDNVLALEILRRLEKAFASVIEQQAVPTRYTDGTVGEH